MKLFFILIFIFIVSLLAESSSVKDSSRKSAPKSNLGKENKEKSTSDNLEDDELDKEFYTYYYMNLPNYLQKEEKSKSKLHSGLVNVLKKEIGKRDRTISKEVLSEITTATARYKRVFETSKWMKKIKSELKYIKFTEYMYIIKYKKYLTLVLYHTDPELHQQSPSHVEFLMIKSSDGHQEQEF